MSVLQSGNVTPGHVAVWTTDGVVQDGGPSSLAVAGVRNQRYIIASPIALTISDQILNINVAAPVACTLPLSITRNGAPLTFKDVGGNAAANNITITPGGSETIDGLATYTLNTNYQSVTLTPFNDGVNSGWFTT